MIKRFIEFLRSIFCHVTVHEDTMMDEPVIEETPSVESSDVTEEPIMEEPVKVIPVEPVTEIKEPVKSKKKRGRPRKKKQIEK